jgi:choline-sulfatase
VGEERKEPFLMRHSIAGLQCVTCFVWFCLVSAGVHSLAVAGQPNVLFLFADDMSYEAVGYAGRERISTPNLDQLARQGVNFTHTVNMGGWNGAICIASRTMLMSGRTLWRAQATEASLNAEREAGRFWPIVMRRAGYRTYFTGKWHIAADAFKSFDVVQHLRPGMPEDDESAYERPKLDGSDPWSPSDPKFGGYWSGGRHWTDVTADDAIAFMDDAKKHDQPFFMYVAFNAPHDPRQSPVEYLDKYPLDQVQVPDSFLERYPYADAIGCSPTLRDERLAPFPRTSRAIQTHRREYFAAISYLDTQIGRVLQHLQSSGLAENTIVVFTADQGLSVGHHGLMGKQNAYDVSVRVPCLIAGPGFEPGKQVHTPIYMQDTMATTIAVAVEDSKQAIDTSFVEFHDLRPILRGDESAYDDGVYFAYLDLQRSVTWNAKKLIVYPKANVVRMFDLVSDPNERVDLAEDPKFASVRSDLEQRLERLRRRYEAKLK